MYYMLQYIGGGGPITKMMMEIIGRRGECDLCPNGYDGGRCWRRVGGAGG